MTDYSVSEMLKITSENARSASNTHYDFLMQVAEHIDKLEATIVELNNKIIELESNNEA